MIYSLVIDQPFPVGPYAVNSICLWTFSVFPQRVSLLSGCKYKTLFHFPQIKNENNSKKLFSTFLTSLPRKWTCANDLIWTANGAQIYNHFPSKQELPQIIFKGIFRLVIINSLASFLNCYVKQEPMEHNIE